jgi:hypothetical protein
MANPFALFKAASRALPAVVMSPSQDALTARLTGINRFGLSGFAALEAPRMENSELLKTGFLENHYVFIVADWKARQFAKAPPIVYEIKDQKSLRAYKSLTPLQKADSYALRLKAIDEVDDPTDDMVKVLANPNKAQTWSEFAYGVSVYYDFGNALIYGPKLDFGPNKGQIREMALMPPSIYIGKNPSASGYGSYLDIHSNNPEIPGEEVLHLRQFNPDPTLRGGTLWGVSKLAPARKLLVKSNNAIDAEAEMMQNRGGRTIIFPKGQQWDETVSAETAKGTVEIRNKLKQVGTGGIVGSGVELGAIELSMSPVDLDIIESNAGTKEDIASLWHLKVVDVFSSMKGTTYANMEEASKSSLRDGVLPDQALFAAKLNQWFVPGYNASMKVNRYIEFNTDVYPALQSDKKEMAQYLADVPLTGDQRLAVFGWQTTGLPEMQIPLISNRFVPVSDFGAVPADPNAKNNGDY